MQYLKTLSLTTLLCLLTGCLVVPVPMHMGTRGPIRKKDLAFLETGTATREDVVLHLGKPEYSTLDERYLDYSWIGAWDIGIIGPAGTGDYEKLRCYTLRFQFDENGKVEEVYTSSYKPDTTINNSEDCYFKSYGSRPLNIRDQPTKEAHEDRLLFIEGETTRAEIEYLKRWGMDLNESRIFWMRWFSSSSDMRTQADLEAITSGSGSRRSPLRQKYRNLLVEFDERGLVASVRKVKDKDVVRELLDWTLRTGYKPMDLSALAGNAYSAWTKGQNRRIGSIGVDAESIRIWDSPWRKWFQIPIDQVVGLEFRSESQGPCFMLKLKNKTAWGDKIYVNFKYSELLPILMHICRK